MFGAIDIGGTKTLIATFDKKGELIKSSVFPTPVIYSDFLNTLSDNFNLIKGESCKLVSMAVPGKIDRNHGIVTALGNLPWTNLHIRDDLEARISIPVVIENDAKLAGLYEASEFPKYRKVLYVTVSTGIGCGLIINGLIDPDFENMEAGLMMMEHEGKLERWQDFASGKAIVAKFGKPASDITDPSAWQYIAKNIAIGLIDLIATLTPDLIVIGGGVGSHFEKFSKQLVEELEVFSTPLIKIPKVVKAIKAEEAVIYGCYLLGKHTYEHKDN